MAITTGRFPLPAEIRKMNVDVIINVSDELITSCSLAAMNANKMYFWFPCTECTRMSLSSIYGDMQVLINYENAFIHCHAGACRSVIIKNLYLLMINDSDCDTDFLQRYIDEGVLPKMSCLVAILSDMLEVFTNVAETNRGGQLDSILLHNKIDYIK